MSSGSDSTIGSGERRRPVEKDDPPKTDAGPTPQGQTGTHNSAKPNLTPSGPEPATSVGLPALHFTYHKTYIVIYVLFLLICNLVIPVILFYPLTFLTHLSKRNVIGISSAALGLSSCVDAPLRLWRLTKHRKTYGPLGNDTWWHLDFVMWTYTFACLVFAIPLAIAPAISFFNFFLMSTVMLIGPIGLVLLVSLFSPKWRVWCSSDPPGTPMKPAVFYVIEDVASVDFKHGREFRRALHERWRISPPFRRLILHVTVYWTICSAMYCAVTALVSWLTPLNFAFAWVLGQMFIWGAVCSVGCVLLVRRGLKKEKEWWGRRSRSISSEK